MTTTKKKITIRFIVEQDFEIELRNSKLGMGSDLAIGDVMVSCGYDQWDVLTHERIFDNPVGDLRPLQNSHWSDANLYNQGLHSEYIRPWLFEGETDKDPYADDEEEKEIDDETTGQ